MAAVKRKSVVQQVVPQTKKHRGVVSRDEADEDVDQSNFLEDEEDDDEDTADEEDGKQVEDEEMVEDELDEQMDEDGFERKQPSKYYKLPTNEELRMLKETDELFKSNVFRLEIKELLDEVAVPAKRLVKLESMLRRIKEIIDTAKPSKEMNITEARAYLQKRHVALPFEKLADDSQLPLKFTPPTAIHVIGSYLLKTAVRPDLNVDLAVEMPKELFLPKDHLNFRYHTKRAFFLAALAAHLQKTPETSELEFAVWNGDVSKPILIIKPSSKDQQYDFTKSGFVIRIFPMLPEDVFSRDRLAPNRNGVRSGMADEKKAIPTPLYNHGILEDMFFKAHLTLLHTTTKSSPSFGEAVILFKVWLRQREMIQSQGHVDGFLMSMLMAALLQKRKLNKAMSSYQMFKSTLQIIATFDFATQSIVFNGEATDDLIKAHQAAHDAVLLDAANEINLLSRVPKGAIAELQHEAHVAFERLNSNGGEDPFLPLFLRKHNAFLKYDHLIRIPTLEHPEGLTLPFLQAHPDFLDSSVRAQRNIPRILLRGLTDRVKVIRVTTEPIPSWPINSSSPAATLDDVSRRALTIGLVLNATEAMRLVEMGPSPDDTDAVTRFQSLWGSKSELRRFKDGAIAEAVTFNVGAFERHLMVPKMTSYLLQRHFGIRFDTINDVKSNEGNVNGPVYLVNQADPLLEQHSNVTFATPLLKDGKVSITAAFDELSQQIKDLEEFPLGIMSIQSVSPALRGTSVFAPKPIDFAAFRPKPSSLQEHPSLTPFVPAHQAIIQVEASTAWPDDLKAIAYTMTAMYLRLGALLTKHVAGIVCEPAAAWLDVLKDGFIFRFIINVERRQILLEKRGDDLSLKEAAELKRMVETRVLHAGAVRAFSQQFPFYSVAVRLATRWLSAHMMMSEIHFEAVESLVAAAFLPIDAIFSPPASPLTAFHRFLALLAQHDFVDNIVIVDWTGEMSSAEREKMNATFSKIRAAEANGKKGGPALMLFSSVDVTGVTFTRDQPSHLMLARITTFAKSALQTLEAEALYPSFNYLTLFNTPLSDYDVIIHLRTAMIPRAAESIDAVHWLEKQSNNGVQYKNLRAPKVRDMPLVEFDPIARYIQDLRTEFGHVAFFFHDAHGGRVIAVKWKAAAFVPQPFKVAKAYGTAPTPLSGKDYVAPNDVAMIAAMRRIGADLIDHVVVVVGKPL